MSAMQLSPHGGRLCVEVDEQLAALRAEVERLKKLLALDPNGEELARIYDGWTDSMARIAALTRALREIADRHIPTYSTNFEWMRDIANDHRRTAAAALAQIEGGKK